MKTRYALLVLLMVGFSNLLAQPRPISNMVSAKIDSIIYMGVYSGTNKPAPISGKLIIYTNSSGDTLHMVTPGGVYGTIPTRAQISDIVQDSLLQSAFGVNAPSTYGNTVIWAAQDSLTWAKQAYNITIDSSLITTTDTLFLFRSTSAITIDSVWYVCQTTGAASIVPSIEYGAGIRQSKTKLITSPSAVTNVDLGTTISSFDNSSIAINKYVYIVFTTVTTKPKQFSVVIYWRYS